VARKFLLSFAAPLSIAWVTGAAGAGDCMTVAGGGGGGGVGTAAGAGAGAAGAGAAGAGVSVVVAGLGCCALAHTMPLIESANAPANSDDVFIRFMCFLPGYFSAGRFADLALPKVPAERDNGPIRCQGEHDMAPQRDG
jgi:hypothetical protein